MKRLGRGRTILVSLFLILIVITYYNIVDINERVIDDKLAFDDELKIKDGIRVQEKETSQESVETASKEYLEMLNSTNKVIHEEIEYEEISDGIYKPWDKGDYVNLEQLTIMCDKYDNHKIILFIPRDIELIATPSDSVVTTNSDEVSISMSFGSLKDMYDRGFEFEYYMKFRLGRTEGGTIEKTNFFKDSKLEIYNQIVNLNNGQITTVKIGRLLHSTFPQIHVEYLIETVTDSYSLEIKGDAQYSDLIKDIIGSYQIKDLIGDNQHTAVLYRDELLDFTVED